MRKTASSLVASACFVTLAAALASPAGAAGFVSFVSENGTDAGDCGTLATACRQITFALSQTNEGGIIHVLPGEYLAFAVDKTLDIVADAGRASIFTTVVSDSGIAVNIAGNSAVRVRGFHISAANGISIIGSGGTVHVEACTIMGAETKAGIVFAPTAAGELYVSDTIISRPGIPSNTGILVKPTGSGSARAVFDNVKVEDNIAGILIDGTTTSGNIFAVLRDSSVVGGAGFGLRATDSGGGATNVMIEHSTLANNVAAGVVALGANTFVRMRDSTVSSNGRGLNVATGARIISFGGNVLSGNTVDGAFTATQAQK